GSSRVAFLVNASSPLADQQLREAHAGARSLGIRLVPGKARDASQYQAVFAAFTRDRASALIVNLDPMFFTHRRRIADLAAARRLPAIAAFREFAEAGGLMAYGANLADMFRRSATYVDKILKGAHPGDLPVEQPTKFDFVINLRTAKSLGIAIPPSILLRADEVIQ
ncbi:MAG: ABC transporter substrate-binding protein, partial [Sulfuricaulis sp.]